MSNHDWDEPDDEDSWSDNDDQDFGDDEAVACPECGGEIPAITDRCSECGYWLTEADQRSTGRTSQPAWLRITAIIVLLAFLASLVGVGFALF